MVGCMCEISSICMRETYTVEPNTNSWSQEINDRDESVDRKSWNLLFVSSSVRFNKRFAQGRKNLIYLNIENERKHFSKKFLYLMSCCLFLPLCDSNSLVINWCDDANRILNNFLSRDEWWKKKFLKASTQLATSEIEISHYLLFVRNFDLKGINLLVHRSRWWNK